MTGSRSQISIAGSLVTTMGHQPVLAHDSNTAGAAERRIACHSLSSALTIATVTRKR